MPTSARIAALLAVLAGLLAADPAAAAQPVEVYPGLDLRAAQQALATAPMYRAPTAPAVFDEAQVLPRLRPDVRILLAPFRPLGMDAVRFVDEVIGPLEDWAGERNLEIVLVAGLEVRLLSSGRFGPTTLDGVRAQLAHRDVTPALVLALENLRSGTEELDDPPPRPAPPDPAERDAVLAGLSGARTYGGIEDGAWLDEALPGGRVRVAALPVLPRSAPDPELLPELAAAFPDDVVVVLRGRWLEVTGPDAAEVRSARDYVLGRYADFLAGREVEPRAIVRLFLERLALLRSGEPFGRPQPRPVLADDVVRRWLPWVVAGGALLLGGGSVLVAVLRARRRAALAAADLRRDRAVAVAELAELDAELLEAGPDAGRGTPLLRAEAAERIATAHALLERARDVDEVRAARDAAAEARELWSRAEAR